MSRNTIVLFILFVFVSGNVLAQQNKTWEDEAEVSYVQTTGNTKTKHLSLKNLLTYAPHQRFETSWEAKALYNENDGNRTAERYSTELRADYSFSKRFYSAFLAGWTRDEFSGIENSYYLGPTLGYKILIGPKHYLRAEPGFDYNFDEYTDKTDESYLRGRLFAKYTYEFTDKTRFTQSLKYLQDIQEQENFNITSDTALITSLTDILSMKTSYEVKYDNSPVPEDLEETDTTLSVTLVINI